MLVHFCDYCFIHNDTLATPKNAFQRLAYYLPRVLFPEFENCQLTKLKSECLICPCNFVISYLKCKFCLANYLKKDLNCETLVCRWSCGATVLLATHWDESFVRSELYKRQSAFKQDIFSLPAEPTRCSDSLLW